MEKIVEREKCTGCTACMNACPKHAIVMKKDEEGFYYPVIDQTKCINCGLCKKICPVINTNNNSSLNECYVAFARDEKKQNNSSSGGIFPIIADSVLDENGIVIGAAFNKNNNLRHVSITRKDELQLLKGSKYLQSDLNNIFEFIKENIKNKKILFVGTPCQVAGLKSFLKKDYDNLICIDLFCHGVPSPKLFEKYIDELEKKLNDKLVAYDFRDKSTGWETYSNTATFRKNKITELQKNNDYMNLFLSDVALRESCFNCNFKLGNKYSDITLGDFWGVKSHYPNMYNTKGVSAIIINSEKGKETIDNIKSKLEYKNCKLKEIVAGNPCLTKSVARPQKRDSFFNDLNNKSISELTNNYVTKQTIIKKCLRKAKNIIKRLFNK